ncbi:unnamed protein product [Durusdinium trenchii]|uniref:Uncharacterized protein n=1 Tax=Durusdinium trenchii TaxID=1381693 RepID=A0ABP0KNM3_9DINO
MAEMGKSELQEEFSVFVLELPAGDTPEEGTTQALALVVLRRRNGLLLAVLVGYFSEEVLAEGLVATSDAQVGQSMPMTLPAGEMLDISSGEPPSPLQDATVDLVLVDVTADIWDHLIPFNYQHYDLQALHTFNADQPHMLPMANELTAAAWAWIMDPSSGERVGFYSAQEEFPGTPPRTPRGRKSPKAKAAPGTGGGEGEAKPDAKKGKPTVASLAAVLEGVSATLPQIMSELKTLRERADLMEGQITTGTSRPSALRQPLGNLATTGSSGVAKDLSGLLQEMPPPRSSLTRTPTKGSAVSFATHHSAIKDSGELEKEKLEEERNPDLTRAILAHSQALSTLVTQMATGDFSLDSGLWERYGQGGGRAVIPGADEKASVLKRGILELDAVELSTSSNAFDDDPYTGGPKDYQNAKVGEISCDPSSLPTQPYTSLCASRLKLVGTGAWDLAAHLQDELWLPFVEPKIVQHDLGPDFDNGPNLGQENRAENLAVAKLWSTRNLLTLVEDPPYMDSFTRIFNAYKNSEVDRQIGDRRLANSTEHSICGPSRFLPGGYLIANISVPPWEESCWSHHG